MSHMLHKKYILECCADSVESALNAHEGGADRLELCGNLVIGGTTPSLFLFEEIRKRSDINIHVLIRPRFGDFLYTDYEKNIMKKEVKMFKMAGAEGVVVGALDKYGNLDIEFMKELIDIAEDMKVVLHRAFDVCKDPFKTLEQSISLGIDTILTSGQQNNCLLGLDLIKKLDESSNGKIKIMAGSGMNSERMKEFLEKTSVKCFHMSAKNILESEMEYRNPNVSMGMPGLSEYEIWRTDKEEIRRAGEILKSYEK